MSDSSKYQPTFNNQAIVQWKKLSEGDINKAIKTAKHNNKKLSKSQLQRAKKELISRSERTKGTQTSIPTTTASTQTEPEYTPSMKSVVGRSFEKVKVYCSKICQILRNINQRVIRVIIKQLNKKRKFVF